LARQGEAPRATEKKARPSGAMPRQSRKREGRRDTGPIRSVVRGSNLAARSKEVESSPTRRLDGFRSGAKHLGHSETVALRGAAAEGGLGRVPATRGSLQPPRSKDAATRVFEGTVRGGELTRQTVSPSLGCPRPVPAAQAARAARLHRGTDPRKRKSSVTNVGSALLRKQRRKRGRGLSQFTDED